MTDARVALVSGGNRGIGREIVRQLARKGLAVALGSRDPVKGRIVADSLAREGLAVSCVELDVIDAKSVGAAVDAVVERHGRLDVLVNNAGILIDGPGGFEASLLELAEETARRTWDTNVLGPARLIQTAVPVMRKAGYGRIVNVSSGAGQLSDMRSGFPAYRMSKSALNALTRISAAEFGSAGIKVNALCPGWVKTDMGGPNATRSVEEGADTAVWLATLSADGPTGGFFRDRKPIPW